MSSDVAERSPVPVTASARPPAWTLWDWVAVTLVTLLGGAVRFVNVAFPRRIMFDETYYAKDACHYVEASAKLCGTGVEQTGVHPPLGKWLLSAGIELLGYDSFGWRIAAVMAGTLTVALLYVLARRLFRSTVGAALAGGLLAIDLLHVGQSRIAMLDVFVPLFGTAAVLFAVLDRDRLADGPAGATPLNRPWRLAAGIAAGAAAASKWSGALFVVLVVVLSVGWEVAARRKAHPDRGSIRAIGGMLTREGPSLALFLVMVPVLVYALTYVGRLDGSLLAAPWSDESWLRALWVKQLDAGSFHFGLEASHPYQSPPWSWLLLKRPVAYFFEDAGGGTVREIMAMGSPLVWWSSIGAFLLVAARWLRRRDFLGPEGVILAGFLINYLPWLLLSRGRSAVFVFYLLPALPFMCLALAYAALALGRATGARVALAVWMLGAVWLFVFYYPLVVGSPLGRPDWHARVDDFSTAAGCEKPAGTPTTSSVTTRIDGSPTTTETVKRDNGSLAPKGWCWI